jgi:hypothetical protein
VIKCVDYYKDRGVLRESQGGGGRFLEEKRFLALVFYSEFTK